MTRSSTSFIFAVLLSAVATVAHAQHTINTYAGGGPDDVAAITAAIGVPSAVAVDASGNIYIASWSHRIFKVDASGHLTVLAGQGFGGYGGDGGPAREATLNTPTGVAVDNAGNVFICDWGNAVIRRVDALTGVITTVAGGAFVAGDNVPATSVGLGGPNGVAVDALGQIYIAETGANQIRKVDAAGTITTVAAGVLNFPLAVAVDGAGNLFVADGGRVQRIEATTGAISLVATANSPSGVAVSGGVVYISEQFGARILQVAAGITTTVAGTGVAGFSGDGGPATAAQLSFAMLGLAADASGNVFITDSFMSFRIRKVDAVSGNINTVAGNGHETISGDGVPALKASLNVDGALATDGAGNVYFPDRDRIRRIAAATGIIETVTGSVGIAADGRGIASDGAGGWLVADFAGNRVRRIDSSGTITTVAGTGAFGFSGDGAAATAAKLHGPTAVAVDAVGNIFVADRFNNRVRKIDGSGIITTVAGNGTTGVAGPTFAPHADGVDATLTRVWSPTGLALRGGNLYIAEQFGHRVRIVDPTGTINTFAGGGAGGDGGPATSAALGRPTSLAFDASGNLYITETEGLTSRVRRVDLSGTIETFAGTGAMGYTGDGGPATLATFAFQSPWGIAIDSSGNMFLGDTNNKRIRRITNQAPVADAGDDMAVIPVEFTPGGFELSAVDSSDADGDALTYLWLDEFGSPMASTRDVTLGRPAGTYTFTLKVSDGFTSDTDTVVVTQHPVLQVVIRGAFGRVTSTDSGIACATDTTGDCFESYPPGTTVTLTATAEPGSNFEGWAGSCAAFLTNHVCTLTMTTDFEARATFRGALDNTPAGSGVSVAPVDGSSGASPVTLTFSSVTTAGVTSLVMSTGGPAPPAGFQLGSPPVYYELTTTATFTGSITVCIDYTGISFAGPPAIFHFEGGVWVNRTTSVDTVTEIVCGSVTSLSPFALFRDAAAPVVREVRPNLQELWPANHRLVPVTLSVDASDNSGLATCRVVDVTSSEPVNGLGDGDTSPDWLITGDLTVMLRAERSGRGSGRVYTIGVRCTDGAGNVVTASAAVRVPHDRR